MFKKILIGGGIIALVGFVLFGANVIGHVGHGVSWVRGKVAETVAVEYELERARSLIDETAPQIRDCKRVIAEKQVDIRALTKSVEQLTTAHKTNIRRLRSFQERLETQQVAFNVGSRRIGRGSMEAAAGRLLTRVQTERDMITSKNERLTALSRGLQFAQTALENLLTTRSALESKVELLETKLRQTEAMQAATVNVELDDSTLAKANEILESCEKRLSVAQQLIENEAPYIADDIDLDALENKDVADQISAWLSSQDSTTEEQPTRAVNLMPEGAQGR